jgi:dTDP-4-dehydrorhamnose reductase
VIFISVFANITRNTIMKILVLGATGMLGSALVRYFVQAPNIQVLATARESASDVAGLLRVPQSCILGNVCFSMDSLCALSAMSAFSGVQRSEVVSVETNTMLRTMVDFSPDVIINAVGVIKQNEAAKDSLQLVPLNTLLPHFLARLAKEMGARLIHVSTDCVFSGQKGLYTEGDQADATDLYGRSKYMGEVKDQRHVFTLRTSIIGHELWRKTSLLEWFLAQTGVACGYRKAIFSGLPTVELARVIDQYVLHAPDLHGLYHISSGPIDKYRLLQLIAQYYNKTDIDIQAIDNPLIDRSLDSSRFRQTTGYAPPAWPELIQRMRAFG